MKRFLAIAAVLLLMLIPTVSLAQPTGGGQPAGGPAPCWPPPCIPIDGGVGFLVAAGLAFGGKKAFDASRKQKGNENEKGAA